jgi:hypothetical protein
MAVFVARSRNRNLIHPEIYPIPAKTTKLGKPHSCVYRYEKEWIELILTIGP